MTQAELVRSMLTLNVRDDITGYCPRCHAPDIELVYETGSGIGSEFISQTYALRCKHQEVCMLRHEFMGEE